MDKERYNQIIDDVYKNFEEWYNEHSGKEDYTGYYVPTKEEFIRIVKTDLEFSEKWGLKIEEKELSLEERKRIYEMEYTNDIEVENNHWLESKLKTRNIPTKKITLEYNNEKIEIYE